MRVDDGAAVRSGARHPGQTNPRRVFLRSAFAAILLVAIGACSAGPRTYEVTYPATAALAALPVELVDHTGLVTGLVTTSTLPPEAAADWREGVRNAAGRPDTLVVDWMGGMCDRRATFTMDVIPGGYRITMLTDTASSCLLAGIGRGVLISLTRPVVGETVHLESGE